MMVIMLRITGWWCIFEIQSIVKLQKQKESIKIIDILIVV